MSGRFSFDQSVLLSDNKETHCKITTCIDDFSKVVCVCKTYDMEALRAKKQYKNVDGRMISVSAAANVIDQVAILSGISHTNIVPLVYSEESVNRISLYFPFYATCLMSPHADLTYTTTITNLREPSNLANLASQISAALSYLHGLTICHRDVKPDNILVSHGGVFLLSDFGSARKYRGNTSESPATLAFFPPEVCVDDYSEHDPQKADLWALGLSVLCAFCEKLPYDISDSTDTFALMSAIEHVQFSIPLKQLPREVRAIVQVLLSKDATDRRYIV